MKLNLPNDVRQAASRAPLEVQDITSSDHFYLMSRSEWERIKKLLDAEEIDPSFYEATEIEMYGVNNE